MIKYLIGAGLVVLVWWILSNFGLGADNWQWWGIMGILGLSIFLAVREDQKRKERY